MINIEKYKETALKILSPIRPVDERNKIDMQFIYAPRIYTTTSLQEYYLIFFLFNDLLEFHGTGKFEKIAWSFPIDFNGKIFLIQYRKLGLGVFGDHNESAEDDAEEIVKRINSAVKSVRPFYNYIAEEAVKNSKFNIKNNNQILYERFNYLLSLYKEQYNKYIENKDNTEAITETFVGGSMITYKNNGYPFYRHANWIAISCIEAFFSWTEHLFVHLAVIAQNIDSGQGVSNLIEANGKPSTEQPYQITQKKQ